MRLTIAIMLLCSPFILRAQDYTVNILSASGFAGGHITISTLEKNQTQWLRQPGLGGRAGAGFQMRFGRGLQLDAEGGYEISYFMYRHTDLKLSLGYQAPFAALRVSYMFARQQSKFKYFYASAGGSYMFTGGASLQDGEFDYTYNIQLAEGGVIAVLPEFGLLNFFEDHSSISYGLIFRYAWTNTITNTMQKLPELNPAVGTSNGNYLGFIVRYHYPIKKFKKKNSGNSEGPEGRIRI